MGFFDELWEVDRARDKLCAHLKRLGIHAQISESNRAEELIECGVFSKSLGLIDIPDGPIRWVNVVRIKVKGLDTNILTYYIKYGVPDPRLGPNVSKIRIKSVRKKPFQNSAKSWICVGRART